MAQAQNAVPRHGRAKLPNPPTPEGDTHRTVTAREKGTGRLVGLGSRSALDVLDRRRIPHVEIATL
jgi:hypothetical protein